jgi:hypothetical protein
MKLSHLATALMLSAALSAPVFAQDNTQDVKDAKHQAEKDHKANKSQAKADKAKEKALKSDKVKDAAKKQDKADKDAAKAADPQK